MTRAIAVDVRNRLGDVLDAPHAHLEVEVLSAPVVLGRLTHGNVQSRSDLARESVAHENDPVLVQGDKHGWEELLCGAGVDEK